MNIQLKDMEVTLTVKGNVLTRVVKDFDGNTVWTSGDEYFDDTMSEEVLDDYVTQMKKLPFWNIVKITKKIF